MVNQLLSFSPAFLRRRASPQYYLDTVNGNDSNDGSESAPFATAGKVNTVLSGVTAPVTLYIVAGSRVEELLELPDTSTIIGAGDLATDGFPLLDGSAELTGAWGTYGSNSYTKSVTTEAIGCLYVTDSAGVPLKFVSSQAAVDAEVGTFTSDAGSDSETAAGTYTITVNVGGDPTGAGYRHSKRAFVTCTNLTMRFVRLRGTVLRNGIDVTGTGDIKYCVFENVNPVHYMVIADATYEDNYVRYQFKGDWTTAGSPSAGPLLEGYAADASALSFAARRNFVDASGSETTNLVNGIGGHADVRYGSLVSEDNFAQSAKIDYSLMHSSGGSSLRDHVKDGLFLWGGTGGTITDTWMERFDGVIAHIGLNGSAATVEGARMAGDAASAIADFDGATIRRCASWVDGTGPSINQTFLYNDANTPAEFTGCVADGTALYNHYIRVGGLPLSDNNVFAGAAYFNTRVATVNYGTLAAHRTATGQDANSVYYGATNQLTDPANGDWSKAAGAGTWPTGAGLERFPEYSTMPADADAAEAVLLALAA